MGKKAPLRTAAMALLLLYSAAISATGASSRAPGSVVVSGNARFSALTARVLRIEYAGAGSGGFDDLPSTTVLDRSPAGAPAFRQQVDAGVLTLSTGMITLRYRQGAALLPAPLAGCDVRYTAHLAPICTIMTAGCAWAYRGAG